MDNSASLGGLKAAIEAKLGVPLADQLLSKNPSLVRACELLGTWMGVTHVDGATVIHECSAVAPVAGHVHGPPATRPPTLPLAPSLAPSRRAQLTAKGAGPASFGDLQNDAAPLAALGVAHGDMVFLLYHFEREVGSWDLRCWGAAVAGVVQARGVEAGMVPLLCRSERGAGAGGSMHRSGPALPHRGACCGWGEPWDLSRAQGPTCRPAAALPRPLPRPGGPRRQEERVGEAAVWEAHGHRGHGGAAGARALIATAIVHCCCCCLRTAAAAACTLRRRCHAPASPPARRAARRIHRQAHANAPRAGAPPLCCAADADRAARRAARGLRFI